MQLSPNEAELALRDELRAFLARHQPAAEDIPEDFDERVAFLRAWQRRLHEAGLVGLSWPREHGGRGATLTQQIVANQELARAGAPTIIGSVGLDVVGPSLIDHGTDAQKARFLDGILSADDIWCQGFSEVGAGSDLASLKARAVDHGDQFVLNGHKVWTSYAQHAQWCAVLARTDPEVAGHRAISYLLVDMASPGIEVRPLVQVTGDPEFGEVYFDDVVVPRDQLLGPLHGGWKIAMHTLAHERGWYGVGRQVILRVLLDRLVEEARRLVRDGRPAIEHPAVQASLAQAHIGLEVLKHQGYRSVGKMIADGHPGLESSVDKIVLARVEQRLLDTALDVLGSAAALGADAAGGADLRTFQHAYFYGRAASVYGGSEQIQKNIISERMLGLPPERGMNLELTDDHRELRAIAHKALDANAPLALARAYLDGGPGAEPLHGLLDELGWHGVGVEDDGFGLPGLVLLAEAAGAHAAPTALVDTAVAARLEADAEPRPTALAVLEPAADWSLRGIATTARRDGERWLVEGEKVGVQHGASVARFAVIAEVDGEAAVLLVPAGAAGVAARPAEGLDAASAPCVVTFDGARADAIVTDADAIARAFAVGAVATAAEGIGAASAALDLALEYARTREQFGRPIGSFQALKHLIAGAHVDREAAWSSVLYAAAALDEGLPEALETASIAKANGARTSRSVVEAALQVLGGIAFTWEHDVHLLQRRVLSCERRFGDALAHEAALGRALADRAAAGAAA